MEATVLCRIVFGSSFLRAGSKFAACFSQLGADFAELVYRSDRLVTVQW
jgi:hypothetical protein